MNFEHVVEHVNLMLGRRRGEMKWSGNITTSQVDEQKEK